MESESSNSTGDFNCPYCSAGLPKFARFCPRCGKEMVAMPAAVCRTLFDGLNHLSDALKEDLPLGDDAKQKEEERPISLALLGFSNAMFRLGWRYEHGQGVFRNEEEADRCYSKSARLGNSSARAKIDAKNQPDITE